MKRHPDDVEPRYDDYRRAIERELRSMLGREPTPEEVEVKTARMWARSRFIRSLVIPQVATP